MISKKHKISRAYNGLQLLDLLRDEVCGSSRPDLILLDLNMPVLNGFEALRKIKAEPLFRHIPVYILSTSRFEPDIARSADLGAEKFYTKPADIEDYKKIIEEILLVQAARKPGLSRA